MEPAISCYTVALLSAKINKQGLRFLKAETMECANVCKELFLHLSMLLISLFKTPFYFWYYSSD